MPAPRFFVSSIMEGFKPFRDAARAAIMRAGAEPILIEDFPALESSPRTACLDGVRSCDAVLTIVAQRGGSTAPSGKLIVEEEFDEARITARRTLVFVQEGPRDADAQRLVDTLSHYVDGQLRPSFSTPETLGSELERGVREMISRIPSQVVNPMESMGTLSKPFSLGGEANIRVIVSPERRDSLVDPVTMGDDALLQVAFESGHRPDVRLFAYGPRHRPDVSVNELVIIQESGDWRAGREEVRMELRFDGTFVIDSNVSGRQPNRSGLDLRVTDEDVREQIRRSIAYVSLVLDRLDPYKRFDRMYFNAALSNLGYRTFGPAFAPERRGGIPMGNHGDEAIIAFDEPRMLTRDTLKNADNHATAAVTMFTKRLQSKSY